LKRTYIFEANSAEDREGWLKALKQHVRYGLEENSIKEGFMQKMGGSIKTWKQRYFILTEDKLKYYKQPGDAKVQGDVSLKDGGVLAYETDDAYGYPHAFSLIPTGSKRKYVFSCIDDTSRNEWMNAISEVIKANEAKKAAAAGNAASS